MRVFLTVFLLAQASLLPESVAAQKAQSGAQPHFARGVELQQSGDLVGARDAYLAALKSEPHRVDANANLGLVYVRLGQFDDAIRHYRRALAANPAQTAVRFHLGAACFQAGKLEAAREEFAAVVKAAPSDLRARQLLAISLLQLNRLHEGIAELEKVYQAQPDNREAAYTLTSAYLRIRQLDKAGAIIARDLHQSNTPEANLLVGSYETARHNYIRAVARLKTAQQQNPRLPGLHSALGHAYVLTGNRKLAVDMFQKELEVTADDFNSLAFLGWLYREDGRLEEAAKLLRKALVARPDETGVLFQLAQISQTQATAEETAQLLGRVVALKPDHLASHVLLAQIYFRQKRFQDAQKERQIIDRLNAQEQEKQPSTYDLRYTGVTVPLN
ncbi:MAG: tetratricopeptide repeat protein [Acidobacteria bacterium]|nr:tetratricopeptide repeat protein [Acidobacteriota bacterium]